LITPADIRNPSRPSGFNYVSRANSSGASRLLWCAKKGTFNKGTAANDWHGPCRRNPLEAAQDYCNYINSGAVTPAPQLKSAGHTKPVSSLPSSPEAIEARRVLREEAEARRAGRQGFVYLAIEVENVYNALFVKIGHTYLDPPEARLAGLQTGNPRQLHMIASRPGTEEDERRLHARYIDHNVLGEWFYARPGIMAEFGIK
jgi:hypothetical protein